MDAPQRGNRVAAWAALGLWLCGCEPVVLDVGQVRPTAAPVDAGRASSDAPTDATAGSDAPSGPADGGTGPADGGADAAPARKCLIIADPTLAPFSAGSLPVVLLRQLSCESSDASVAAVDGGFPPSSGVYGDDGGEPIMKRGQPYSLQWDSILANKLRIFGGREPCEAFPLYEEFPPDGGLAFVPGSGCRDLTPSQDVRYLRVLGGDLVPGSVLQLCADTCP